MRKHFFRKLQILSIVGIMGATVFVACGKSETLQDNTVEETETMIEESVSEAQIEEDKEKREADFKEQYSLLIETISLMNINSDYVGATHATVWDAVGVDNVAKYVGYIREYWNNEDYSILVADAYGNKSLSKSERDKYMEYAKQYHTSLEDIDKLRNEIDEMYKSLNSTYGSDFNIDDLKEYYVESEAYADYATNLDGSYVSYCQTLNDYQDNLTKLKKYAEIAY